MDSKQTEQKLFDEPKERVEEGYIWTPEKGLQKNIKQPLKPKPEQTVPEDLKERYDYAVAIMRNMDEHWELKEGNEVLYAQYQRDIADIERIAALQTDLQRLQSAKDESEQEARLQLGRRQEEIERLREALNRALARHQIRCDIAERMGVSAPTNESWVPVARKALAARSEGSKPHE